MISNLVAEEEVEEKEGPHQQHDHERKRYAYDHTHCSQVRGIASRYCCMGERSGDGGGLVYG